MLIVRYTTIESPIGPLLLAADEAGLRRIEFVNGKRSVQPDPTWNDDGAVLLQEVTNQLRAYFFG